MSAVPMTVEALMARVAALEAQNSALAAQTRAFEGRIHPSQPRDDGKPGSKQYGSITIPLAKAREIVATLEAEGAVAWTENFSVYGRVNRQTGEEFDVVQASGRYVKKAE